MSTFTTDFPYIDFSQNIRLGYRLPIKVIVPSYMLVAPIFEDFFDAIDTVFDKRVYEKTNILGNLRNMWVINPETEQKILNGEMLDVEDWSLPEREIVGKQLNLLGLQLGESASLFSDKDFIALCRFLGMYWFEKGMSSFMAFVNYSCRTHYTIVNLWTKDYEMFYPEGDSRIGTPIWEGGEWYPTTHVQFTTTDSETNILALALLFKEIANYNLVLDSINVEFNMNITNGYGSNKLYFSTNFTYHTTFKLSTYNSKALEQREIFGYQGTQRYGYDLARYAENDYDDSVPSTGETEKTVHAFYSIAVVSLPMQYPVLDEENNPLEEPLWEPALGAYGVCLENNPITSDSYGNIWVLEETGGSIVLKYATEDPFGLKGIYTVQNGLQNGFATYITRQTDSNILIERMDDTGKSVIIGTDQMCLESLFTKADVGTSVMIKVTKQE